MKTQWQELLEYLENGNSITSIECFYRLGFTQLHGRLFQIQQRTDYRLEENKDAPIFGNVILWEWENDGQYKRYWIPKRLF